MATGAGLLGNLNAERLSMSVEMSPNPELCVGGVGLGMSLIIKN